MYCKNTYSVLATDDLCVGVFSFRATYTPFPSTPNYFNKTMQVSALDDVKQTSIQYKNVFWEEKICIKCFYMGKKAVIVCVKCV